MGNGTMVKQALLQPPRLTQVRPVPARLKAHPNVRLKQVLLRRRLHRLLQALQPRQLQQRLQLPPLQLPRLQLQQRRQPDRPPIASTAVTFQMKTRVKSTTCTQIVNWFNSSVRLASTLTQLYQTAIGLQWLTVVTVNVHANEPLLFSNSLIF